MKPVAKSVLILFALAPVVGFFPFELHYALAKVSSLIFPVSAPQGETIQAPGFSLQLLIFLEDWLQVLMALVFATGVFWLSTLIRRNREVSPFYVIWGAYFCSALSYFLMLHLVPFFFAVITLAVLAKARGIWAQDHDRTAQTSGA